MYSSTTTAVPFSSESMICGPVRINKDLIDDNAAHQNIRHNTLLYPQRINCSSDQEWPQTALFGKLEGGYQPRTLIYGAFCIQFSGDIRTTDDVVWPSRSLQRIRQ